MISDEDAKRLLDHILSWKPNVPLTRWQTTKKRALKCSVLGILISWSVMLCVVDFLNGPWCLTAKAVIYAPLVVGIIVLLLFGLYLFEDLSKNP